MIVSTKECGIAGRKYHFRIMKVSNLPKRAKNRVYWAGEKPEDVKAVTPGVMQKRCSRKFHKIYKETPVLESFFNTIEDLTPATL